ncbi:MAG TPA: hypothetical protein VNS32_12450 [Flavisolibacter sp.]|nr:hypothetical protein [Flavisolibacter sp.]
MRKVLLPILLVCTLFAQAQKKVDTIQYKMLIGFSPLAMIQDDNVLMANGEYRLTSKLALAVDAGYIFYSSYYTSVQNASGFIFRPAIRGYMNERNNFYIQGQAFYKSATYLLHDWLNRDVENGVPAYQEMTDFRYRKNVVGGNFMIGTIQPIFKRNGYVDLYMGFGLRYKKSHLVNEPRSTYRRPSFITTDDRTLPSLPMGIKFMFVIQ